jgi:hypothetical protein
METTPLFEMLDQQENINDIKTLRESRMQKAFTSAYVRSRFLEQYMNIKIQVWNTYLTSKLQTSTLQIERIIFGRELNLLKTTCYPWTWRFNCWFFLLDVEDQLIWLQQKINEILVSERRHKTQSSLDASKRRTDICKHYLTYIEYILTLPSDLDRAKHNEWFNSKKVELVERQKYFKSLEKTEEEKNEKISLAAEGQQSADVLVNNVSCSPTEKIYRKLFSPTWNKNSHFLFLL